MKSDFKYSFKTLTAEQLRIVYMTDIQDRERRIVILNNLLHEYQLPKFKKLEIQREIEELSLEVHDLKIELELALL